MRFRRARTGHTGCPGRVCSRALRAFLFAAVALWCHWLGAVPPELGTRERPILVGVNRDYPPYEFVNADGNPDGYDVELIRAVARVMGLEIRIVPQAWDQVRSGLESGRIDLAPGMLKSQDRMRFADFSEPHMVVHYSIFVRRNDRSPTSLEDLRNHRILVEKGSQMHEYLVSLGFGAAIVPVGSEPETLRTLAAGHQDAALAPTLEGMLQIREAGLSNIHPAGAPVFSRELCMALAKGHEDLGAKLATGLTILHRTGEYETIHHHWFGALEPKPLTAWQIARTGLWVFLPLVLGILAVLVWNGSLRRRVHRATAELQASEALLKAVIDSIPLMLFVKDPNRDFQFTVWNTKAEELIGIPRQELLGKTDYDILPAEQVEQLRAADIKVLESARQLDIPEETILSPVRGAVLLHTIKVPVRDEEGRVRFLLGISEDLTVFKRIEAQLCRSQASLSGAQRLARMGSWEWDFAKKEAYWSDGMFRILGLEPGACQPSLEAILNLSHPLDRERLNALLDPDAIEGSPETLDHRVILPDGTERVLLSHLEIQRDAAGKALRILGTAQDITERRTAEESLRQTQRLESLGVLAGGIAHDFNNLLTAILGNLNLAQKQAGSGHPALPYLQKIENTVMRASTLARQMLAYSGRGTFLIKPLDLNRLVQEMTHLLEVSISKKTVFRFALDPFIPWIDADEGQIQQVVMNLVTNAAEAIGDIEGLITLCTRMQILDEEALATQFTAQELRPGTYVVLEVKDTGCGMEPEVLRRLFEPFYTTKFSGRGLGLSALRGILKSHKGGIQIESEPGGGSTFRLYFPASSERPLAESEPQESPEANQSRGTILIAEDEPMIRLSTSEMLQSLGYRVLEAPDGLVAVELFRTHQDEVSAVLLDLTMPRMDGREALRAILALQPDAKVIICSGYHEQEALQGTEARTITGFLAKPYRLRELQGLLDRVL